MKKRGGHYFTLKQLWVAMTVLSGACACWLLPSGLYIHLPVLVLGTLGIAAATTASQLWWQTVPDEQLPQARLRFFGAVLLFALVAGVYFPFVGLAVRQARNAEFAAMRKQVLLNVKHPIAIRDAARRLHRRFQHLPPEQRRFWGNSALLPPELAALRPNRVIVRSRRVFIEMCYTTSDWFGLVVFAEDAPPVGVEHQLADGIFYWESL